MVIAIFYLQKKLLFETTATIIPNDIVNYPYNSNDVRFSTLFMLFLFFIRMLAFPHPLRYDYSYNQIPAVQWDNPWAWAGVVVFAVVCYYGIRELRKGSAPGLAIAFYLITLIPAAGFILLRGGIFAERFLFAPSLGFCIAVVWLAEKVTRADFRKPFTFSMKGSKAIPPVFAVVLVLILSGSIKTVSRNQVWKDPYTLYSSDIKTGKESAQNQLHLGVNQLTMAFNETDKAQQAKYIDEGMQSLREATRILPTFGDAMFYTGYAYELKAASQDIKNIDSAILYYKKAAIHAPAFFEIYIHLGDIYKWMQRYDSASFYFNEAVRYNPSSVVARNKAEEMQQLIRSKN
jgi:tetratricopeptide (TPR) repeat protein